MRRFVVVAVVALSAALALSACSLPAGVDGNLVNDWAAAPAPTGAAPTVGACYLTGAVDMLDNKPVACTVSHSIEVAHVGTFTGATAARLTPPPAESVQLKAAYASCQAPVNAYLGAPWNSGLVTVSVAVPDDGGWQGGARWFRCDVSLLDDLNDLAPTVATVSLKGALTHQSVATISCVRWTDHKTYIDTIKVSSCKSWFNGEYAGFYTAPNEAWPSSEKKQDSLTANGCEAVVAHYLGYSGDTDQSFYVGIVSFNLDEDRWNLGDRTVRCFAAADTKDGRFTASVKGIRGNKPKG
jgi:hypothetical protein